MPYPTDQILTYLNRFCNRLDVYAIQKVYGNDYWYEPVHQPLTEEVLEAHLAGDITVGFYSLSHENSSKWVCLDFDYEGTDMERVLSLFRNHGWRCLPEGKRPGRDGHLWLFFDVLVAAVHLRRFAKEFIRKAGIPMNKIEVFPKNDKLKNDTSLGNLVRGPLGIHRKPGANMQRGWFEGASHDVLSQLEWFHSQQLNHAADIVRLVQELEGRQLISKAATRKRRSSHPRSKSMRGNVSQQRVDWLEYVRSNNFEFSKGYWNGPCPSCKTIGHDSDSDHMSVSESGKVGCWRGCSFQQILDAVRFRY